MQYRRVALGSRCADVRRRVPAHVTVRYSKAPMEWPEPKPDKIAVPEGHDRELALFGDALVLKFSCNHLQQDHARFLNGGASHEFESYQPHVTITYGYPQGIGMQQAEPRTRRRRIRLAMFTAATLGTDSSISPGGSCPSECANGSTGSNQRVSVLPPSERLRVFWSAFTWSCSVLTSGTPVRQRSRTPDCDRHRGRQRHRSGGGKAPGGRRAQSRNPVLLRKGRGAGEGTRRLRRDRIEPNRSTTSSVSSMARWSAGAGSMSSSTARVTGRARRSSRSPTSNGAPASTSIYEVIEAHEAREAAKEALPISAIS